MRRCGVGLSCEAERKGHGSDASSTGCDNEPRCERQEGRCANVSRTPGDLSVTIAQATTERADLPLEGTHPKRSSPVRSSSAPDERGRMNLYWLVQLHWWAILGQVVIIAGAEAWTHVGLPLPLLITVVGLELTGNVALGAWARRSNVTDGA